MPKNIAHPAHNQAQLLDSEQSTTSHRLKVVHFAETIKGGPATHLNELVPHQSRRMDVTLVVPAQQIREIYINDARILTFDTVDRSLSGILRLRRIWRSLVSEIDPDIVHLHSSFAGLIGRSLLGKKRYKTVYCARGWSFAIDNPRWKKLLYATVERILSLRTDAIINISHEESALSSTYKIPQNKCRTVYNGISDAPWRPLQHTHPIHLLYIGRFDKQKGIDVLFRAYEHLDTKHFTLTVIGGAVLGNQDALIVPPGVRNLGWCSREDILRELEVATAVVVPSRWEGFGFVAAEALRSGRPVVASRVGGLKDIVVEGHNGFFSDPGSESSLVASINKLLTANLAEMSQHARLSYEARFTAERMATQISDIYREIL